MTEELRHEIVQRRQSGMSLRAIAEELGISRGSVYRALARVQAQRDGQAAPVPRTRRRGSIVDAFEPILKELLAQYPNLTVERALQELRSRGYTGGYTVVRQRVRLLRPRPALAPVTAATSAGRWGW
jgi:transposase